MIAMKPLSNRTGIVATLLALGVASLLADTRAMPAPSSRLKVRTLDSRTGKAAPSRVYLLDAAGMLQIPPGAIVYQKHKEHHFISGGEFEIDLPSGTYSLTVERGPEFRPWSTSIRLEGGQSRQVDARPERWVMMNERGWYSADLHNHRKPGEMPTLLLAEDLNLSPTILDWIWEDKPISRPPDTREAIRQVDPTHVFSVLDKEVERLEWGPGAVDLLALKSVIPFEGDRLSPPNDVFCRAARAQGGYIDAEKIVWRDGAALAALGFVDFAGIVHNHFNRQNVELETESWGMIPMERPEFKTVAGMPLWSMEVYYRLINCGFRIAVSAGSASGVKASPVGYNRVYAKLDGPFSYDNWFRALKAGRSFGTNGPMLFLTVNGVEVGDTVRLEEGRTLEVRAEASSTGPLDRLEIVSQGRVVKTVSQPDPSGKLVARFETRVEGSGWFAARCFERPTSTIRFAHTSPVYVDAGRGAAVVPEDARYFVAWIDRELDFYRKETRFRTPQDREAMLSFFERARRVYAELAASGRE